jgi:hypothetical protein
VLPQGPYRGSLNSSDLVQVDPATNQVASTVSLGNSIGPARASGEHLLVAGGVVGAGFLARLDPIPVEWWRPSRPEDSTRRPATVGLSV